MFNRRSQIISFTALAIVAGCAKDVVSPRTAGPEGVSLAVTPPVINVPNIDSLYRVINDTLNAGRDVRLQPNLYPLDRTKPNGGRLELQRDMTLRGEGGRADEVIIDASALAPSTTGAIRVGRGTNAVESLTIRNADSLAAGIETDLGSGPSQIRIAHVISTGNVRGIDVRNTGLAAAHRALVVELTENELFDNGQGVRFVNANGATGASISASIDNNKVHGNGIGCLAANLNTDSASISIDSHADRFEGNGNGCVFLAGNSSGALFARHNTISVKAQASRFEDNGIAIPAAMDSGGVVAVGAVSVQAGRASNNTLVVDLWGIRFRTNYWRDIAAFGAQGPISGPAPGPAGTSNRVTVMLHGISNQATVDAVASRPTEAAGTNTVTIVR